MTDIPDTLIINYSEGGAKDSVTLPLYYKEPVFYQKKFLHPEIPIRWMGEDGELVSYSAKNDDLVVGVLLIIYLVSAITISKSAVFLKRQIKFLRFVPRGLTTETVTSRAEEKAQYVVSACNSLTIGILLALALTGNEGMFSRNDVHTMIVVLITLSCGYFLFKKTMYEIVNNTFFEGKFIKHWNSFSLFANTVEIMLLLPLLTLEVFYDFGRNEELIWAFFTLLVVKLLHFYKLSTTFFSKTDGFLQNILYFCALELNPIILFAGIMTIISNKIL